MIAYIQENRQPDLLQMNTQIVWTLLLAIATFEGFWKPGSRAARNNNPGNLRGFDPDVPKDAQGFDQYQTLAAGIRALWIQIWINIFRNLTIEEFFLGKPGVYNGYAPEIDGNTKQYPRFVSSVTGIPLDSVTILRFISG